MAAETSSPAWLGKAGRFFARLAAWQARRPMAFVAAALAVASVFAMLALRLQLETQLEQLLPENQPSVVELRRLQARVAQGSNISVVLEGSDTGELRRTSGAIVARLRTPQPDWLIEADDGTHAIQRFVLPRVGLFADREQLERLRGELDEAWRSAVMKTAGLGLGIDERQSIRSFEEVRDRLFPTGSSLSEIRGRYPDGYFQSADGRALVVLVRTSVPPGHLEAARVAYEHVQAVTSQVVREVAPRDVHVGYAGDLVTGLSEYGAVRSDLLGVGIVGVSLVLTAILLFFWRLRALAALGVTIAVGLALTFGVTELAIGHLNVATGFLVSIVAGNGINSGIIYTARYFEARREGATVESALSVASTATWLPTFGAAAASAAAYGSLGITHFLGLRHFALIGGAGMLLCWLATYLVTPPLLALFERLRELRSRAPSASRLLDRLKAAPRYCAASLVAWIARVPATIALLSLIVTAGSLFLAARYLTSDPMEYDLRRVQNDLGSATELYRVSRIAGEILGANLESSMIVLADRLDQVVPLKQALEARRDRAPAGAKPFEAVHTLFDFVAPDQEAKILLLQDITRLLRRARAHRLLPDADWKQIAPILPPPGLEPYGVADLPAGIAQPFTEKDGTRGKLLFIEPTAGQSDSDLHYLLRWTDAFRETTLPTGEKIPGSGRAVIFADMLQSIVRDMPPALGLSLLMTLAAVAVTFRRGLLSWVVLGSLLAGVTWLVALMELLDVRLNFINFVAVPVTFGIGVDYALNVVHRYSSGESILTAVRHTGAAVVLCSLTTILSYLALLGSMNQAVRSLGLVAVLGEVCCLTAAVVALPAALLWWERRKARLLSTRSAPA